MLVSTLILSLTNINSPRRLSAEAGVPDLVKKLADDGREALHAATAMMNKLGDIEDVVMLQVGILTGESATLATAVPAHSALALLAGRVLPSIWEQELDAIESELFFRMIGGWK